MLEASSLLIHPWRRPDEDPRAWSRAIADGDSSAALGRARWRSPPEPIWLGWLRSQGMEVLETEDAALLMMLVRPWGVARFWDVYDAEERRVGTIAGRMLLDTEGGRRAFLDPAERGACRILDPSARLLGEWVRQADGLTRLRFAGDAAPNPFLRMLLLGYALTRQVPPWRRSLAV
jgi:hypothetical protein